MEIKISNLDNIQEAASAFIQQIGDHKVFAFYGSMGAGKTTFVKAICESLGVDDVITSPTFAIINEYHADDRVIYHFDFYRIKNWKKSMIWAMKTISTADPSVSLNGRN